MKVSKKTFYLILKAEALGTLRTSHHWAWLRFAPPALFRTVSFRWTMYIYISECGVTFQFGYLAAMQVYSCILWCVIIEHTIRPAFYRTVNCRWNKYMCNSECNVTLQFGYLAAMLAYGCILWCVIIDHTTRPALYRTVNFRWKK